MTQEEKARAYNEALERAKKWYYAPNADKIPTYAVRLIPEIFPELRESEDERIRKALIDLVKSKEEDGYMVINNVSTGSILAWLEKQDEKKPKKVSIWKHWKDGIAGNAEGEQIFLVKIGGVYGISSCLGGECEYIELSELDKLMREEKQAPKPKWSDEDEELLQHCCGAVAAADYYTLEDKEEMEKWLKSIEQRMEE